MSQKYPGGIITKNPTEPTATVAKGIWTAQQAASYAKQGIWPRSPGAPTVGTASVSVLTASVPFTAPTDTGSAAITNYIATSSPSGIQGTSATSPISVTGLSANTTYTFQVQAINGAGTGSASASSNSVTTANVPGAPTIGTATATTATAATVTYTAPASDGGSTITLYTATSSPGGITGTLATAGSGTITVSGLTTGTSYTFTVTATNAIGTGAASGASNSITPTVPVGQQAYTTGGSYTWVAPVGVTKVSVVAVGSGGTGLNGGGGAGGGAGLGYKNNISVNPGCSYTVYVGPVNNTSGGNGSCSYFMSSCVVKGGYGKGANAGGSGGNYTGDGGGNGGTGGGGAGGYAGNGGNGGNPTSAGSGGGGGGGRLNAPCFYPTDTYLFQAGGGGVGILGQGANGAGGTTVGYSATGGGGGSGGSAGATVCFPSYSSTNGGNYGGGGTYGGYRYVFATCTQYCGAYGRGGGGAVRIIWPGNTRQFPSTCTGDL